MLVFAIPLRSRANSLDWARVCAHLRDTLHSALRQTLPDIRVVLACTDVPDNLPDDPRLVVAPTPEATEEDRRAVADPLMARHIDMYRKRKACLVRMRDLADLPSTGYVMPVDADDLVHRAIAEYVRAHPAVGYRAVRGFEYNDRTGRLNRAGRVMGFGEEFHLKCGTSVIHPFSRDALPQSLDDEQHPHPAFTHRHRQWARSYAERGIPLHPLPFPVVIYRQYTGENERTKTERASNYRPRLRLIRQALMRVPVTAGIRDDFALPTLG